jgi:formylmethanofuran dehydrogenase subunit B
MARTPLWMTDLACTGCGCVCDDLEVLVEENRVVDVTGACNLVRDWYLQLDAGPACWSHVGGQPASPDDAIRRAAELLRTSRQPLIFGLSRSATDGQRAALALADRFGAIVDTTASLEHAPSVLALQDAGESTCTLGEVRGRADLVIFWGADPQTTHPRHFERYSVRPTGRFIADRADRFVIAVDSEPRETSADVDLFLQVDPGKDFEALSCLRAMLRGRSIAADRSTGLPVPVLAELLERMKRCRYGIVFFGLGLSEGDTGHRKVEALLRLTQELNDVTRFHARRLRLHGDVTGADLVLAWQSGFPFATCFSRGYPRFEPDEFSAHDLLLRGEVDLCLLVGSETVSEFDSAARARLASMPTVVLDRPGVKCPFPPTVQFTTAIYGVHAPGVVYRMDEVPIRLRAFLRSDLPTDAEVLRKIDHCTPSSPGILRVGSGDYVHESI